MPINKHKPPKTFPICEQCGEPIQNAGRQGQKFHAGECKRLANNARMTKYHAKYDRRLIKRKRYRSWQVMEIFCLWDTLPTKSPLD